MPFDDNFYNGEHGTQDEIDVQLGTLQGLLAVVAKIQIRQLTAQLEGGRVWWRSRNLVRPDLKHEVRIDAIKSVLRVNGGKFSPIPVPGRWKFGTFL